MKNNRESFILKNNIKYYRSVLGISQSELAELCNCSRNTISNIENYIFFPTAYLSGLIALNLGRSWSEVFYFEEC